MLCDVCGVWLEEAKAMSACTEPLHVGIDAHQESLPIAVLAAGAPPPSRCE